jgi:feruloyl esterase
MKLIAKLCSAIFIVSFTPLTLSETIGTAANCEKLSDFKFDAYDLTINISTWSDGKYVKLPFENSSIELPTHCHVEGELDRRKGVSGKDYRIGFAINLPEKWNGRFLFQGGSGLNGSVQEPLGNKVSGDTSALLQGFAVVSTDTGHQGAVFDASFAEDQEALLNFLYKANVKVTEVSKKLTAAYYGNEIDYSYFVGCSTGGREGMLMSQRYPDYFDGIVSGAPAMRAGFSNIGVRWVGAHLNEVLGSDASGAEASQLPLSDDDRKVIMSGLINRCDGLDGTVDGLLFNTQACDFDPLQVACAESEESRGCLPLNKAKALKEAMTGPIHSNGKQVYPAFAYDFGIDDKGYIAGILNSTNKPPVDQVIPTLETFDLDAQVNDALNNAMIIGDTALWKNMSSFVLNGSKHILYHGSSDPWFSVNETIRYYQSMAQANGGIEKVTEWSRLF